MKKLIFTSLIAVISFTTFAQGNSQKNKNKNQSAVSKKDKNNDDRYDDRKDKNNNDKYEDRKDKTNEDRNENRRDNRKYSKNTPRKVSDAFRRDFPNATNVTWTKNTGTWTANFGGAGIINNIRTVTYKANGERVSSNGIFR